MADDKKTVEIEAHVWAMINFAAKVSAMTESEVVEAAIVHMAQSDSENEEAEGEDLGTNHDAEDDAHWDWQTVHIDYMGHRVEALFHPTTEHVRFTSQPFAPDEVMSPSRAVSRVIKHFNPDASHTKVDGRQLWILTELDRTIADVYG